MTDLKKLYDEEIKPKLKEELGLANVMQVPRITHIEAFWYSFLAFYFPSFLVDTLVADRVEAEDALKGVFGHLQFLL